MKNDFFISYSREDLTAVTALVSALRAANKTVDWDRTLRGTKLLSDEIKEKIEACDRLIAVWSVNAVKSEWVFGEAEFARSKAKIISIRIEPCEVPLPFRSRHIFDIFWSKETEQFQGFNKLLEALSDRQIDDRQKKYSVNSTQEIVSDQFLSAYYATTIVNHILQSHSIDKIESLAAGGNARAIWALGAMLSTGSGLPKNDEIAYQKFSIAAEKGLLRAVYNLGHCKLHGLGCTVDIPDGLTQIRKAAESGVAIAQFLVGQQLENGQFVEKDGHAAFRWYHKSALNGCSEALDAMGFCYFNGIGIETNPRKALEWFQKAADAGHARAITMLGAVHADGEICPKDINKAIQLFEAGYWAGYDAAALHLGEIYAREVTPVNSVEAMRWYKIAGKRGLAEGYLNLAQFIMRNAPRYDSLEDVRYTLAMAADMARQPNQGSYAMLALRTLGELCERGIYGPVDLNLAREAYEAVLINPDSAEESRKFAKDGLSRLPKNSKVQNNSRNGSIFSAVRRILTKL